MKNPGPLLVGEARGTGGLLKLGNHVNESIADWRAIRVPTGRAGSKVPMDP
jgi:hypothetical protein